MLEKPKNDTEFDDSATHDGVAVDDRQAEPQPTADPPAGHTVGSDI